MNSPISTIDIYNKSGAVKAQFNITDNCTRECYLCGDDVIRLSFYSYTNVGINAFDYIRYNGKRYYAKASYIPKQDGRWYSYDVKFYSCECLLDKFIMMRKVSITDTTTGRTSVWKEAEFSVNFNKQDICKLICDIINEAILSVGGVYSSDMNVSPQLDPDYSNTKLNTFSYSGTTIQDALNGVAEFYECDWYIRNQILYIEKQEEPKVSDTFGTDYIEGVGTRGNTSRGITELTINNVEESRCSKIYPFGSERNITLKQAVINGMNVSYNRRLKLDPNTTYTIPLLGGNSTTIRTDADGAIIVPDGDGSENVLFFDDVYPSQVFKIRNVQALPLNSNGGVKYVIGAYGSSFPSGVTSSTDIVIADGVPSVTAVFESGQLNSFEFDVLFSGGAPQVMGDVRFTIVPIEDEYNGMLPQGNMIPRVGDTFSLFGIVMPDAYVDAAKQQLAMKAYESQRQAIEFQPSITIETEPRYVYDNNVDIFIGKKVRVESESLLGGYFENRVVSFSHSLTNPYSVQITIAENKAKRILAELQSEVEDVDYGWTRRYNHVTGTYTYVKDITLGNTNTLDGHTEKLNDLDDKFGNLQVNMRGMQDELFGRVGGMANDNRGVAYADLTLNNADATHTTPTILNISKGYLSNASSQVLIPEIDINLDDLDRGQMHYLYAIFNDGDTTATLSLRNEADDEVMALSDANVVAIGRLCYVDDEWVWSYSSVKAIAINASGHISINGFRTDVSDEELKPYKEGRNISGALRSIYVGRELVLSDEAADKLAERLAEKIFQRH